MNDYKVNERGRRGVAPFDPTKGRRPLETHQPDSGALEPPGWGPAPGAFPDRGSSPTSPPYQFSVPLARIETRRIATFPGRSRPWERVGVADGTPRPSQKMAEYCGFPMARLRTSVPPDCTPVPLEVVKQGAMGSGAMERWASCRLRAVGGAARAVAHGRHGRRLARRPVQTVKNR